MMDVNDSLDSLSDLFKNASKKIVSTTEELAKDVGGVLDDVEREIKPLTDAIAHKATNAYESLSNEITDISETIKQAAGSVTDDEKK